MPEVTALLALYEATSGASWGDLTGAGWGASNQGWLVGHPCLSAQGWSGVRCSADNHPQVEAITLRYTGLEGTLPSTLGLLAGLRTLRVGINAISGTLPTQLGRLSKLQTVGVDLNEVSGTVPSQLATSESLTQV